MYGAMTCGHCAACREGRDNLCENVGGLMGFHIDGFARDLINLPARLVIPVPAAGEFVTPILEAWDAAKDGPLPSYEPGSDGPGEADKLIQRDGRQWRKL